MPTLEALGIIKQYETKRDGGDRRQSSNVIVVMPVEKVDEQTQVTPDMSRHKAPSKKLNNNTYKDTPSTDSIIKRGLKLAIPTPIYNTLAPFLNGQAYTIPMVFYYVLRCLLTVLSRLKHTSRLISMLL